MIEYKGLPLFGDDSNPRNTSKFLGFIGTCVFWFIFIICMILIRPAEKEKRKYKDVQIVFEALPPLPPPPVEEVEEVMEPDFIENLIENILKKEPLIPDVVEEKVVQPEIEPEVVPEDTVKIENNIDLSSSGAKQHQESRKEGVQTGTVQHSSDKKNEVSQNKKDVTSHQNDKPVTKPVIENKPPVLEKPSNKNEERPANQKIENDNKTEPPVKIDDKKNQDVYKPPKKEPFDWDAMFGNKTSNNVNNQNFTKPNKVETKSSSSGSAGKVVKPQANDNTGFTSQQKKQEGGNTDASSDTKGKLGDIADTKPGKVKGDGGDSEITVNGKKFGGGNDFFMKMNNGDGRGLISPKNPSINLSSRAISELDVSKTVTVTFIVLQGGNVPISKISISPAASLPQSVIEEIKKQVSEWRFESSSRESTGQFEYKIIKK